MRIQDLKLGGAHLKKLRRAEGGAKIVGVFRVKNHDFTPKNHIFSNFRGGARRVRPPLDPPLQTYFITLILKLLYSYTFNPMRRFIKALFMYILSFIFVIAHCTCIWSFCGLWL